MIGSLVLQITRGTNGYVFNLVVHAQVFRRYVFTAVSAQPLVYVVFVNPSENDWQVPRTEASNTTSKRHFR